MVELIHPISEEKRAELERSLAREKERLFRESKLAADAMRYNFSISRLIREYPVESSILLLLGSYVLTQVVQAGSRRRSRVVISRGERQEAAGEF